MTVVAYYILYLTGQYQIQVSSVRGVTRSIVIGGGSYDSFCRNPSVSFSVTRRHSLQSTDAAQSP